MEFKLLEALILVACTNLYGVLLESKSFRRILIRIRVKHLETV